MGFIISGCFTWVSLDGDYISSWRRQIAIRPHRNVLLFVKQILWNSIVQLINQSEQCCRNFHVIKDSSGSIAMFLFELRPKRGLGVLRKAPLINVMQFYNECNFLISSHFPCSSYFVWHRLQDLDDWSTRVVGINLYITLTSIQ